MIFRGRSAVCTDLQGRRESQFAVVAAPLVVPEVKCWECH